MSDPTIHILSTRPLSSALLAEAADHGIGLEVIPFITTEAVEDEALERRVGELGKTRLVAVFTSMNAVEAVAGWTSATIEWTIFCIGSATRGLVKKYFGEASIADTAASALELSEKIVRQQPAQEVFFFCGDQRREELPSVLRQAGFSVNELVVYRTKATPHKTERSYEGIVFFSPSAVESFFSLNTVGSGVVLFAIGRTTANAVRKHCNNPLISSEQPDKEALIRQVIDHFQTKNRQD